MSLKITEKEGRLAWGKMRCAEVTPLLDAYDFGGGD